MNTDLDMNRNCDVCMYNSKELKNVCTHEGPCRGDVQSTGIEHYFHEFTLQDMQHLYAFFRQMQLTELLVTKSILCRVIKEWYDGEER